MITLPELDLTGGDHGDATDIWSAPGYSTWYVGRDAGGALVAYDGLPEAVDPAFGLIVASVSVLCHGDRNEPVASAVLAHAATHLPTAPTHRIIWVGTRKIHATMSDSHEYPVLIPVGHGAPTDPTDPGFDLARWAAGVGGWVMPRFHGASPEIHAYAHEIRRRRLPVRYFRDRLGRTIDVEAGMPVFHAAEARA